MRAGGVRGAIFAVFADGPDGDLPGDDPDLDSQRLWGQPLPDPLDHAWAAGVATRAAGRLAALELAGEITIARAAADLDAVHDDPALPPAAVLHVEGAEAIDPELEALPFWYEAGLRSLGPVWSRPNWFGEGVPFRAPSSPDTGGGLTDAGRRLVARCGELGILVDLSHLNEQGFWDVAQIDAGPLVASHSGAHALSQNSRNLTDSQLDAIGSSGGLIGIVYAPAFLREDFADASDTPIELIARHAAYVAERIGVRARRPRLGLRRRPGARRARRRRRRAEAARRARGRRVLRCRDRRDRLGQLAPRARRLVALLSAQRRRAWRVGGRLPAPASSVSRSITSSSQRCVRSSR